MPATSRAVNPSTVVKVTFTIPEAWPYTAHLDRQPFLFDPQTNTAELTATTGEEHAFIWFIYGGVGQTYDVRLEVGGREVFSHKATFPEFPPKDGGIQWIKVE